MSYELPNGHEVGSNGPPSLVPFDTSRLGQLPLPLGHASSGIRVPPSWIFSRTPLPVQSSPLLLLPACPISSTYKPFGPFSKTPMSAVPNPAPWPSEVRPCSWTLTVVMVPLSPLTVSSDGYTVAGTHVPKPVPLGPAGIDTLCVSVQVYGLLPVHCALARPAPPKNARVAHTARASRLDFSQPNPNCIVEPLADNMVETSHRRPKARIREQAGGQQPNIFHRPPRRGSAAAKPGH